MTDRWLKALPWLLVALAVGVIAGSVVVATDSAPRSTATPEPTASPTVTVAPLKARVPAHLIVISKTPLTQVQRRLLVRATGAKDSLVVSAAQVFMARAGRSHSASTPTPSAPGHHEVRRRAPRCGPRWPEATPLSRTSWVARSSFLSAPRC